MPLPLRANHPLAVLGAVALGGAALLIGGLPTRGQDANLAAIRVSHVGRAPRRANLGVTLQFQLPDGLQRLQSPSVKVTDSKGALVELLPTYILRGGTAAQAFRELHSENYPSGNYDVAAELTFRNAQGRPERVTAPAVRITVAGRGSGRQ